MRDLHVKLMNESRWYNAWHSHRGHGLAHWFLFLFVALLITSAVSEGINRNYLSENLAMSNAAIALSATMPAKSSRPVPGQYIIVFKDDVKDPKGLAQQLTKDAGGELKYTYTSAIKGFAAKIPDVAVTGLRKNPNIKYLEQDQTVQATVTQSPATVGLDRIDQLSLPLDNSYTYNYTGSGVHAYVIDTGIRSTHTEFTGRMGNGFTSINDASGIDGCNWHGTHVAGTLGGTTVGVAKGVTLHSVRTLDCAGSGTTAGVIAGVDWVSVNKISPAVANMSLSGGFSQALNDAVRNSINSGITYVVAAGNNTSDACFFSPGSEQSALTIGSIVVNNDSESSFSNWGTCLDIYAPGSSIYSAHSDSDTAMRLASGTSMASPHVAGVAALYLQTNPSASPSQVATQIISKATTGSLILSKPSSPNVLLNSLFSGSAVTPPSGDTQAPSAPTGLSASASGPNTVGVSWTGSTDNVGTAGYKILRNGSHIASVVTPNTSYTDTTVSAGTTYNYAVSAYDAAGNNSASSNTVSVLTPTNAVTSLDISSYGVTEKKANSIRVNWVTNIPSTGVITYWVKGTSQRLTYTDPNNATNHFGYLQGLSNNTAYEFRVDAAAGTQTDSINGSFRTARK